MLRKERKADWERFARQTVAVSSRPETNKRADHPKNEVARKKIESLAAELAGTVEREIRERGLHPHGHVLMREIEVPRDDPVWVLVIDNRTGGRQQRLVFEDREGKKIRRDSKKLPVVVSEGGARTYWLYQDTVYSTAEDDLGPDEVLALLQEAESRKRLKIARAKTVAAMADRLDRAGERQPIPRDIKIDVWQRDGGKCVQCGSKRNLEFDHIIPHSMGGADTVRNLQLLCADCNREKGASL